MPDFIDVWNALTFDGELCAALDEMSDLSCSYFAKDHDIFLAYDLADGDQRPSSRPDNPFAVRYHGFLDRLAELMQVRTIRSFHHSRLTDFEVERIVRAGVELSNVSSFRGRLNSLVKAEMLTSEEADALFDASPLHSDQGTARTGKFWMTSHPVPVDDRGIVNLLGRWGGEVASFWLDSQELIQKVGKIGRPRIVELAVPVSCTNHAHSAATAVLATHARSNGAIPSKSAFDLYSIVDLPPNAVLRVHTEGERRFASMGIGYPSGYVDVDMGRWEELTGEKD